MKSEQVNYNVATVPAGLPSGCSIEKLAVFLNEVMKPYEDTVPDVARGLEFALSGEPGRGGFVIVAEQADELVGAIAILNTGMSGYVPAHLLLFVAVRPELRGRGIGAELIIRAKDRCSGDIKLHVEPDNPARRLYERQGFSNKYLEMRFSQDE